MAEDKKKPAPLVEKKKKVTKPQSAAPKAKAPKIAAPPPAPVGPILPSGAVGNYTMGVHASEVGAMQREMSRREKVGAAGPQDIGFGVSFEGVPYANAFEGRNDSSLKAFAPGNFADRLSDFVSGPGTSKRRRTAERFKAEQEASRIPNRAAVLRGDLPSHRTLDNPRPDLGGRGGRGGSSRSTFETPARPNVYPFGNSSVGVDRRFASNDTGPTINRDDFFEPFFPEGFSLPGEPLPEEPEPEPVELPSIAEPPREIIFADNTPAKALAEIQLRRALRIRAIMEDFQNDESEDERRRAV